MMRHPTYVFNLDHSQEALEMARIQETTKQLEQQKKIKVNLHTPLAQLAVLVPIVQTGRI